MHTLTPYPDIMIAGLAWQVFTLVIFIGLALDFTVRTIRRTKQIGNDALDSRHAALRKSWQFKGFLVALSLATLLIFTRCVYRVAELSEGWDGHLIKIESYFIGLEGAIILAAVYLLNMFHPGVCFKEALETAPAQEDLEMSRGRTWYGRQKRASSDSSQEGAKEKH
jgi:hypothetical protein